MPSDAALARSCADLAGAALLRDRARGRPDAGPRGDALAHRLIVDALHAARPGDVVFSEEATDDPARLRADLSNVSEMRVVAASGHGVSSRSA